jgi:hypothetical protein
VAAVAAGAARFARAADGDGRAGLALLLLLSDCDAATGRRASIPTGSAAADGGGGIVRTEDHSAHRRRGRWRGGRSVP